MKSLKEVCYNNLDFRNIKLNNKVYLDRLEEELSVIEENGFTNYMYIIADLVNWGKRQGWFITVRGSASGSLIAYLLGISEIDPIKYELSFARFLNKARIGKGVGSFPDIDVDIPKNKRQEALDYLVSKYGKDKVFLISNYSIFTLNSAIRKINSAYSGDIENVTVNVALKHSNLDDCNTVKEALEMEDNHEFSTLYKKDPEFKEMCDIAEKLVGRCSNFGLHAAGVVVFDESINNICPISVSDKAIPVIQCDKKDVEKIGGIKLDLLGLATGDVITETFKTVKEDWYKILSGDFDDKNVYENIIKTGKTDGCFQIETHGLKETLSKIQADCFDDLVAAIALYRPGSKDYIDDYANVKLGGVDILEVKPYYKDILDIVSETYGVILYQEQSMKISQVIANFTDSEADVLRKAIGKKDKELMEKCKKDFLTNANDKENAKLIWEVMEKSGDYSFNKSHAVAYAQNAYLTAWLKNYYPKEFLVSILNYENNEDKIKTYFANTEFEINSPCIFESKENFVLGKDGVIYYGLKIKGIKNNVIDKIIENQDKFNPEDFNMMEYISSCEMDKRSYEALVKAGAFDKTGLRRSKLLYMSEELFKMYNKNKKLPTREEYEPYQACKNSIFFVDIVEKKLEKKLVNKMIKNGEITHPIFTEKELREMLKNDYKNLSLTRRKTYRLEGKELLEQFNILYRTANISSPISMLKLEYDVLSGFFSVHPNKMYKLESKKIEDYDIGDDFDEIGVISESFERVSKRGNVYYKLEIKFDKFNKNVILYNYRGRIPYSGYIIRIIGKIEEYKGNKTIKCEKSEIL